MKSEDEIEEKLEQLRYEHLQKRLHDRRRPHPKNCKHNYEHTENGESIRLCMIGADEPDEWGGRICDDVQTAEECPFFTPQSKEQIEQDFEEEIMDPEVVNSEYRDIAALRWVLGSDGTSEQLTWWKKLKLKLTGGA